MSFSADGKQLAIVQWDGSVRLWDLQPQKREEVVHKLPGKLVTQILFNPHQQRKQLAIGFFGGRVKLLDLERKDQVDVLKPDRQVGSLYRLCFSSDGKLLATAATDGTFQVYDLEKQKPEKQKPIFCGDIKASSVFGISFNRDGKQLFTGSGDGIVRLWDLEQKIQIHQFRAHQGTIYYLSVSPDGETLATASTDCRVRLWNLKGNLLDNLKDEKPAVECKNHQGPVYWVSFSPDGQQLATASGDGTVRLWNLQGEERKQARCIHPAPVLCVNFIPGKLEPELVTACWDGKVRLWSRQGKLLGEFTIGQDPVLCVSSSPDGELLATVSNIWNGKAQLLKRTEGHIEQRIAGLIKQGCEWLDDYFAAHPEQRKDFQICFSCPVI